MERPGVSLWWFPLFLFAVLSSTSAQNEPVYTAVNGDINLKPASSGPINNILWKHKGDLVVEWVNKELDYYGMFKGPTTLDTTTGGLVIKNTNETFAGLYTVEINSQVQSKGYEVEFINKVTKPGVDQKPLACTPEKCKLVCNHDETAAFGPLTYSWREGDGDWKQVTSGKEMPINDVTLQGIETFSCRVKNPISLAESDPHNNPFYKVPDPPSPVGPIVGCFSVAAVVAIIVFVVTWWKGMLKEKLPCLPDFPLRRGEVNPPANSNGDAGSHPHTDAEVKLLKVTSSNDDLGKNPSTGNVDDLGKNPSTGNVDDLGKNPSMENVANTAT